MIGISSFKNNNIIKKKKQIIANKNKINNINPIILLFILLKINSIILSVNDLFSFNFLLLIKPIVFIVPLIKNKVSSLPV